MTPILHKWRDLTARRRLNEGYWAHAARDFFAPVLLVAWCFRGRPPLVPRPGELVVSFTRNERRQEVASADGSSATGYCQTEALAELLNRLKMDGR
jgi:hypothetical protein